MYQKNIFIIFIIFFSLPAVAGAKLCKEYVSCAEVIHDYPSGNFGRKDGDKDGIPCENVCKSLQQVKKLLEMKSNSKNLNNGMSKSY